MDKYAQIIALSSLYTHKSIDTYIYRYSMFNRVAISSFSVAYIVSPKIDDAKGSVLNEYELRPLEDHCL